jgi:4-amino-4-deoxy-L-arabinose transferase-like glycosyltransferase
MTVAVLSIADRDLRWIGELRPLAGGLLTAIIVAPWLIAIQSATGGHFISESLSHDLLPKLVGAQEAHGAPPGYYLLLTIASFWPGSLFVVAALLWGWQRRHASSERFLLAWLIPGWIFLELVPTKLPHYVLPLYPALALLAGSALAEGYARKLIGLGQLFNNAIKVLWAAVTVAIAVGLVLLPGRFGDTISPPSIFAAPVLLGLTLTLLLHDWRLLQSTFLVAAGAAAFVVPAATVVVPRLDQLWVSRSAAAAVARHSPRAGEPVLTVGYSEPSLVFLLGTATTLAAAAPATEQLAGARLALVNRRDEAQFLRALSSYGLTANPLERVTGLDYSAGGGKLVLTLYRLEPG